MIVRNEGSLIRECLESVKPLIDSYAIMDTGSTDDTIEIIKDVFSDIPGRVETMQWQGFSECRNAAIDLAGGLGDYLFFLDADDKVVLETEVENIKSQLHQSLHPAMIFQGSMHYQRVFFRATTSKSRYEGVVHEVLVASSMDSTGKEIQGLSILYNALGVSDRNKNPHDKYLEDAKKLEVAIAQGAQPAGLNARYHFYLAQSYRGHGDHERALAMYEKRYLITEGWAQERYMSAIEAGRIYQMTYQNIPAAIWAFLRAAELDPHRAEAHFHIAAIAREQCMWQLAMFHARKARQLPIPRGALFVDDQIYQWKAVFEVSVAAYYVGEREEGASACAELMANPTIPDNIKILTVRNRQFYV